MTAPVDRDAVREQIARALSLQNWGNAATRIDREQFWLDRADAVMPLVSAALVAVERGARAEVWDECLDAIEANEINTQQAREGNPYRKEHPDDA